MKQKHFHEVDPDIRRFMQTCPRGQYKYCSLWGVDHWKDGRIFYYTFSNPADDWVEVLEPMSHWREALWTSEAAGIDEEEWEQLP